MEYRMEARGGPRPSLMGFGGLRFPVDGDGKVCEKTGGEMIDRAMEGGVTYYDTAWTYLGGQSESVLGRALSRYPRESWCLATKLPCWQIKSRAQAEEIFARQLERAGVDYFDSYLFHTLTRDVWRRMVELGVVELMEQYQKQGLIRRFGFSFHDSYQAFEEILTARAWDCCLIQLNYLDVDFQAGLRGYRLAQSRGVPVLVMEPVKGGLLANLPEDAARPFRALNPRASLASWGMRWVASLPNVGVVLSGMGAIEQVEDNLNTFGTFSPLSPEEQAAVEEVGEGLRRRLKNGCTGCRYCLPCPAGVDIPGAFQLWNKIALGQSLQAARRSWEGMDREERPDQCYRCGQCERRCPQHLPIRAQLAQVTEEVEAFLAQGCVPSKQAQEL